MRTRTFALSQRLLVDGCGFSQRAYIETAMKRLFLAVARGHLRSGDGTDATDADGVLREVADRRGRAGTDLTVI